MDASRLAGEVMKVGDLVRYNDGAMDRRTSKKRYAMLILEGPHDDGAGKLTYLVATPESISGKWRVHKHWLEVI